MESVCTTIHNLSLFFIFIILFFLFFCSSSFDAGEGSLGADLLQSCPEGGREASVEDDSADSAQRESMGETGNPLHHTDSGQGYKGGGRGHRSSDSKQESMLGVIMKLNTQLFNNYLSMYM